MRFIRHPQLKDKGIPYSREHLRELEKRNLFPKRVPLTDADGGYFGYVEEEIDAFLAERIAARDAKLEAEQSQRKAEDAEARGDIPTVRMGRLLKVPVVRFNLEGE